MFTFSPTLYCSYSSSSRLRACNLAKFSSVCTFHYSRSIARWCQNVISACLIFIYINIINELKKNLWETSCSRSNTLFWYCSTSWPFATMKRLSLSISWMSTAYLHIIVNRYFILEEKKGDIYQLILEMSDLSFVLNVDLLFLDNRGLVCLYTQTLIFFCEFLDAKLQFRNKFLTTCILYIDKLFLNRYL
jgi:hypothetical protein